MTTGLYKVNLLSDTVSACRLGAAHYDATLRDIHRSCDIKFRFNGGVPINLPTSELASASGNNRYQVFINFMARHGNGITLHGETWNRFFCGMYQDGFLRATQQIVNTVATVDGKAMYVGAAFHTLAAKEEYAALIKNEIGEHIIPFDTKIILDIKQTTHPKTGAITLTVVEHVDVIDFNKKEVCARFVTTSAITGRELNYVGTIMEIKTDTGKELFTDTRARSILTLIKEFFEHLIRKSNKSNPKNTATFFKPERIYKPAQLSPAVSTVRA